MPSPDKHKRAKKTISISVDVELIPLMDDYCRTLGTDRSAATVMLWRGELGMPTVRKKNVTFAIQPELPVNKRP